MAATANIEYIELKRFLRRFADRFMSTGLPPELQPVTLLEKLETTSPKQALHALRMAVNDCVEMSWHWPLEQVLAFDAELNAERIVTLSRVRQRYSSAYSRLLKRGIIRHDVDYYLAQGILADQSVELGSGEREKLQSMAAAYERSAP